MLWFWQELLAFSWHLKLEAIDYSAFYVFFLDCFRSKLEAESASTPPANSPHWQKRWSTIFFTTTVCLPCIFDHLKWMMPFPSTRSYQFVMPFNSNRNFQRRGFDPWRHHRGPVHWRRSRKPQIHSVHLRKREGLLREQKRRQNVLHLCSN